MSNSVMTDYYARRALEYEHVYLKPERQQDLKTLKSKITEISTALDLLEIACGTGYWTQIASRSAKSILATDYSEEVLSIARGKQYDCPVTFLKSDVYSLEEVVGSYSGALVCFWWSHIPKLILTDFLNTLHSKLCIAASIIILDNRYVEGSSSPICRIDAEGNTYQVRCLSDGSTYEVLKNFPEQNEITEHIVPFCKSCEFIELEYYWLAEYILKETAEPFNGPARL